MLKYFLFLLFFLQIQSNKCILKDISLKYSQEISKKSLKQLNWAIICLIRKQDNYNNNQRNNAIINTFKNYKNNYNITIIMFSEDNFNINEINEYKKQFNLIGNFQFIDVKEKAYYLPEPKYGYKWMCKFFTVDLYEYLINYDYYIRIDSDNILESYINQPNTPIISYDIMEYVVTNNIEYGYVLRKYDPHPDTQQTLPSFIENYIQKCSIKPTIPIPDFSLLFNFYNNFHVAKVSFFLDPKVRHFLVETNSSGKLYEYRWGDSTLQAVAVRLFMEPSKVQQLPDITYRHTSHGSKLVSSVLTAPIEIPQVFPDIITTSTGQKIHGDWTKIPSLSDRSIVIKSGPKSHPNQNPNKKKGPVQFRK